MINSLLVLSLAEKQAILYSACGIMILLGIVIIAILVMKAKASKEEKAEEALPSLVEMGLAQPSPDSIEEEDDSLPMFSDLDEEVAARFLDKDKFLS